VAVILVVLWVAVGAAVAITVRAVLRGQNLLTLRAVEVM